MKRNSGEENFSSSFFIKWMYGLFIQYIFSTRLKKSKKNSIIINRGKEK